MEPIAYNSVYLPAPELLIQQQDSIGNLVIHNTIIQPSLIPSPAPSPKPAGFQLMLGVAGILILALVKRFGN